MSRRRKQAVGLCIGSHKIAVAQVHADAEGTVKVDRVSAIDTPDNAVYQGKITNPAAVAQAIRALLAQMDIGGVKEVSLAIPDEGSITRTQVLPPMSRSETLEALVGEVENYAVMAGGEPVIDFQTTDNAREAAGQQAEVVLVAIPRESFDAHLSTMEAANLRLSAMETASPAVLRALTNFPIHDAEDSPTQLRTDNPAMLVTIEENVSLVTILQGNDVRFIHNMEIGAKDLRGEMDFRRRELAREIQSSVDYYHSTFPDDGQVEKMVLLTDDSDMTGLHETLQSSLNLPVIIPQAAVTLTGGAEEGMAGNNLSMYAAIGAATRAYTADEPSINLLLSSKGAEVASLRKRVVLLSVLVFSAALLAVGARVYLGLEADSVEQKLITLRSDQAISEAEASAHIPVIQTGVEALKSQTGAIDAAMDAIQWPNITRMFEEIRAIMPRSVWLIRLNWTSANVTFEGFGQSWDSVATFRDILLESPYFDPVKVRSETLVEISGQSVVRFRIQCGVEKWKLRGGGGKDATI